MDTNWRLVALLYVAGLLAAGQFAKVALTLDALALRYPDAGEALPLTVSALAIMGMVFGATAGSLAARIGLRPVLIGGLVAEGVVRLEMEGPLVTEEERLLTDLGRVRDVEVLDDGSFVFITDYEDGQLVHADLAEGS